MLGSMLSVVDLALAVESCCICHFSSAIVFAVAFFSRLCCASLLRCSPLLPTVVASFFCCCRYAVAVTVQLRFPLGVGVADIIFDVCVFSDPGTHPKQYRVYCAASTVCPKSYWTDCFRFFKVFSFRFSPSYDEFW